VTALTGALAVAAPQALLRLAEVSKRFGGVTALDGVGLEVSAGEIHGLVGENGAGKSTLMKLLAGAYAEYEGQISMGSEVCRFSSPADARAHGIAMVYQELSTFSHLTVAENLLAPNLPRARGWVNWSQANRTAERHLRELGLDIDVTSIMGTLPIGWQQLVEIARVIFSGASVIILDEPTSALSPPETARLYELMRALKAQGKALILISHHLDDVVAICDRITVLRNGRRVATLTAAEASKPRLIELMIGSDEKRPALGHQVASTAPAAVEAAESSSEKPHSREVLRVEGLGKRGAFSDVSFSIHEAEILGCFAFMGAGQAQLGRCLFGAERAEVGTVSLNGEPLKLTNTSRAREAGIAFVPEDRRSALMLSKEVFKNVTIAHLARLLPWWLRERAELALAQPSMQKVGVRPSDPRLPASALSGGNQQKVVLAKWLTRTPRVLVLNEPTRGMDVGAKHEVLGVIERLRDEGVATLLISTEPETVLALATRVLVLRKGRIVAELSGRELCKENLLRDA
jgi:ribose transport system ATP-binding protein